MTLRELVCDRIRQMVRNVARTGNFEDDYETTDLTAAIEKELGSKSDAELLNWYDRLRDGERNE
ncbi:MAG: hypothetical protein KGL39_51530 [Patescibacteria group bacterium]|nr:hypothetical protein [Patescibacteria group bacterium]